MITTITGSKGKTTISRIIATALTQYSQADVLLVDSTGSYKNLEQQTSLDDSLKIYGATPNVRPGRYISYFRKHLDSITDPEMVLEASFGCSTSGLGYPQHDYAIFSNVYPTDLNYSTRTSAADMFKAKAFIYEQLKPEGHIIFSLDNEWTRKVVEIEEIDKAHKIGVSLNPTAVTAELKAQVGQIYVVEGDLLKNSQTSDQIDLSSATFNFLNNSGAKESTALAAAYLQLRGYTKKQIESLLSSFRFPSHYGRLALYTKGNSQVIVDFAHDVSSIERLIESTSLANEGKTIGLVTRVHPSDHFEQFTNDLSQALARQTAINKLILFDKIDGTDRKQFVVGSTVYKAGEVAKAAADIMDEHGLHPQVVANEVDALAEALLTNDIVVHIHSDHDAVAEFLNAHGFMHRI